MFLPLEVSYLANQRHDCSWRPLLTNVRHIALGRERARNMDICMQLTATLAFAQRYR